MSDCECCRDDRYPAPTGHTPHYFYVGTTSAPWPSTLDGADPVMDAIRTGDQEGFDLLTEGAALKFTFPVTNFNVDAIELLTDPKEPDMTIEKAARAIFAQHCKEVTDFMDVPFEGTPRDVSIAAARAAFAVFEDEIAKPIRDELEEENESLEEEIKSRQARIKTLRDDVSVLEQKVGIGNTRLATVQAERDSARRCVAEVERRWEEAKAAVRKAIADSALG